MYRNIYYSDKNSTITYWTWDSDGKRVERKEHFKPYLYIESVNGKDGISMFDSPLRKIEFTSENDRRNWLKTSKNRIFGNIPVKQQFILEKYKDTPLNEMLKYPLKVFLIDIEAVANCFPDPKEANYPINVITIHDSEKDKFYVWGLSLDYNFSGLTEIGINPDDVIYMRCIDEKDLLTRFIDFWSNDYPDVVSGWNNNGFDIPYIINRCKKIIGVDKTKKLSPINWLYSSTKKNFWDRYYTHWTICGVADIDYMELYAKSEKGDKESYKLDYIAQFEKVGAKLKYESSNLYDLMVNDWNTFVTYNIQDVNIIKELDAKKRYLTIGRGKAYRGFAPLEKCLDSVPIVQGMIAKSALDEGKIILTSTIKNGVREDFKGGYVYPPSGKLHEGIVSFDVNSLYPNTMITLNTSPETKVGKIEEVNKEKTWPDCDIQITLTNGKQRTVNNKTFKKFLIDNNLILSKSNILFSQKNKGLCAKFLDDLYTQRISIRKAMETEPDPIKAKQMDIEQYLIKILLNSVYGVFGNPYFCLYDIDIASSVTLTGQAMIKESYNIISKYAKEKSNCEDVVVYSDSVTGNTPIMLRDSKGQIDFKQIDDISDWWTPYNNFKIIDKNRFNKEQAHVFGYEVWTSNGWSKIKKLIRHKVEKDIYRVKTHIGLVDVTEDHSLLDINKKQIKPKDCKLGQELLHSYPTFEHYETKSHTELYKKCENIKDLSIKEQKSFIYGFFYGDGSCGYYSGNKYSWALNNSNMDYNNLLVELLKNVYNSEFKILDTIKSSKVYKIVPVGSIKNFVNEYRNQFYNKNKFKIVPKEILNTTSKEKEAFLCGYFLSDGYKCDNSKCKNLRFNNKGKIGLSGLIYLCKSLGYNVSLNDRQDKPNNYIFIATNKKLRKPEFEVKDVYKLDKSNLLEYVYDIETENGDFNTGTPLIVKNTDSGFFDFGKILNALNIPLFIDNKVTKESLEIINDAENYLNFEINKWAKEELNSNDPRYHFSREKICLKGLFLAKKNYILRIINNEGEDCDKLTAVGVELQKSTHSEAVKNIMWDIVNCIFYDKGKDKADSFYLNGLNVFKQLSVEDISKRNNVKEYNKYANAVINDKVPKGTPYHIKGSIYYNKLLDKFDLGHKYPRIQSGQKVKIVFVDNNKYGIDALSYVDEFPKEFGLLPNYESQYKKMVTSLIKRCYDGNNWALPNIDKRLQTELFSFLDALE